jgi:hypothetical protein
MARYRCLSGSISRSRKVCIDLRNLVDRRDLEFTQLLFTWVLPHCDDFGRLEAGAEELIATVMPHSRRPEATFEAALRALHAARLILVYVAGGRRYLQTLQWDEHQAGLHKRTRSKCPDPPPFDLDSGNFPEFPGNAREIPGNSHENRTELNEKEQNVLRVMNASLKDDARARIDEWVRLLMASGIPAPEIEAHMPNITNWAKAVTADLIEADDVRTAIQDSIADRQAKDKSGKPFIRSRDGRPVSAADHPWWRYLTGQIKKRCLKRGQPWPFGAGMRK